MPILTHNPKVVKDNPIQKPREPEIHSPGYRSTVVDTRYTPQKSLLTHIEGTSWEVAYYQQVLGADEALSSHEMGKLEVYQQYHEILHFELKVTRALEQSTGEKSVQLLVTGEAHLYPSLIPNVGDVFLADIGQGKEGFFSVTSVQRLTIYKTTCFRIEYTLIAENDEARKKDLLNKVIKTYYFTKELIGKENTPLLTTTSYELYLQKEEAKRHLTDRFLTLFYHPKPATLIVPDQGDLTFDPHVIDFIRTLIDSDDYSIMKDLKSYPINWPGFSGGYTLWSALLHCNTNQLNHCREKTALFPSEMLSKGMRFRNPQYSGINTIVYPLLSDKELNNLHLVYAHQFKAGQYLSKDITHQFKDLELGEFTGLSENKPPSIYSVDNDEHYVLSKNFYHRYFEYCSQLELLLWLYFYQKPRPLSTLMELVEDSEHWTQLEVFYYLPLLLLLLKTHKSEWES